MSSPSSAPLLSTWYPHTHTPTIHPKTQVCHHHYHRHTHIDTNMLASFFSRSRIRVAIAVVSNSRRHLSKRRAVNVVLLEDLALRGFEGEQVAVKPGFARNFLIPTRKAVYATPENQARHVVERSEEERVLMEERRDFAQFKVRAAAKSLSFTRKVGVDGVTLEPALTKVDLAAAVRKQLKRRVEEGDIRLPRGSVVKTLGDLEIKVEVSLPQLMVEKAAAAAAATSAESPGKTGAAAAADGKKKEAVTVKVVIHKDETKRERRVSGGDGEISGGPSKE